MDIVVFLCHIVKTLHMLFLFMLIQVKNYYYSHFIDEETETQKC